MESKLVCKDLLNYLQDLPLQLLSNLYQHSASCLAVFRQLPSLSKQYVMRVLFLESPLPLTVINSWALHDSQSQKLHQAAITKLENLRVFEMSPLVGGQQGVVINAPFRDNIRILICGGGSPWALVGHTGEDKHARDIDFLDTYADTQWEAILNFMVSRSGSSDAITRDTVETLQHAGLYGTSSEHTITTNGFQFLLMPRSSQVWYFITKYLSRCESKGLDLVQCLTFIFQLSFLTLGNDYSTEGLTESQLTLLQHLRQFGLTYQRKRSSKRYYPTKLATTLISGVQKATAEHKTGFILLETNFRILAYTESQLQIAILDLFCQLQYRFPNMVVGTITRESVHKALKKGIVAEQILSFLRIHAQAEMLKNHPVIPPTVSDQIRLWEMERDRLELSEGVLYSEFLSVSDFESVRKYAEDLGVLTWSNPGKRLMVVSSDGHNEVKRFWRRQSKK